MQLLTTLQMFTRSNSRIQEVKKKKKFDTWKKNLLNLNWIYLHKIFVTMYSIPYTRA